MVPLSNSRAIGQPPVAGRRSLWATPEQKKSMRSSEDPALLTAEQRLSELAAILAAAILRRRARAVLPNGESGTQISADSGPPCLDVPAKTVLSVLTG